MDQVVAQALTTFKKIMQQKDAQIDVQKETTMSFVKNNVIVKPGRERINNRERA
jgi:hypothetical protein